MITLLPRLPPTLLAPLVLLVAAAGFTASACGASPSNGDAGPPPSPTVTSDTGLPPPPPEDAEPPLDAATDAVSDGAVVCGTDKLRVVAGNLSGAGGTYDDGRGARIFKGLRPDVALVQELRVGDNSPAAQRTFVDDAFGAAYTFVRGSLFGAVDIPNAVVSRYPIVDSGEWADPYVQNRTFVWARIDVPGPADLYAISVHFLTTNATDRNNEAQALVGFVKALPAGSLLVFGGDLNTNTRTENAVVSLAAVFATEGPYPVDQADNASTNTPRSRPYDWVLSAGSLEACKVPVSLGAATFPSGLVFDSRVYAPLNDVDPVMLGDSDSPLQHMAVVRDFLLPK